MGWGPWSWKNLEAALSHQVAPCCPSSSVSEGWSSPLQDSWSTSVRTWSRFAQGWVMGAGACLAWADLVKLGWGWNWDMSSRRKETQNYILEEPGGEAGVANPRTRVLQQEPSCGVQKRCCDISKAGGRGSEEPETQKGSRSSSGEMYQGAFFFREAGTRVLCAIIIVYTAIIKCLSFETPDTSNGWSWWVYQSTGLF